MLICHAGGISNVGPAVFTKETYLFDPETNHLSQLESHPEMDVRSYHSASFVARPDLQTDLLFMYGGYNSDQSYLRDLWMMDINVQGMKSKKA